ISNIARKEINESGKEVKQPIKVNQRLNEIIRTEKKPYKLNYKDFNETIKIFTFISSFRCDACTFFPGI
ncbi:MAG: hypothetical protein II816_01765, partial [Elusimicrobia bacterium]|nr:hypothetical protein [Elusimicrobiota bacterium]